MLFREQKKHLFVLLTRQKRRTQIKNLSCFIKNETRKGEKDLPRGQLMRRGVELRFLLLLLLMLRTRQKCFGEVIFLFGRLHLSAPLQKIVRKNTLQHSLK